MTATVQGAGRPGAYITRDGTRVPGVTTLLGRFKESGPLLQWAFKQGQSGARSLYEKRDEAAEIGSVVHDIVEGEIHGREAPPVPPAMADEVASALSAWHRWRESHQLQIIATEVPYVSEVYRFGGTLDAVAREPDGRLVLLDWKTSNGVYTDYLLQLAAYKLLWDEWNPSDPITGGFHLVRFSKSHGDMEHRYWPDLAEAAEMFLHLRAAYDLDAKLKRRAS
jgi:hypothetical protein